MVRRIDMYISKLYPIQVAQECGSWIGKAWQDRIYMLMWPNVKEHVGKAKEHSYISGVRMSKECDPVKERKNKEWLCFSEISSWNSNSNFEVLHMESYL